MTRVALVTGGGTGIGAATARRLAADGYGVVVTGRRAAPLEAVAAETGAVAHRADMSVPAEVEAAVAVAVERFGGLDALVVNAGVGAAGSLASLSVADFERAIGVNLTGAFAVVKAAMPHLLERRGALVTIASAAALRAAPESYAYCSSKAGLAMLTQCVALDHGPLGVRANCVCPGWVRTPMADAEMDALAGMLDSSREDAYATVTEDVPLRRPSAPEEIAAVVAWLLSEEASYLNGAVIPVDGGHTMVDVGTLAFGKVG